MSKTTKECYNNRRGKPSLVKPTNRGALQISTYRCFRFSTSTGLFLSVDLVASRASRASWETGRRGIASPFASKRKHPFLIAPSTAQVDLTGLDKAIKVLQQIMLQEGTEQDVKSRHSFDVSLMAMFINTPMITFASSSSSSSTLALILSMISISCASYQSFYAFHLRICESSCKL